jgi:transcriptional regulator with XRE-family HTH domain
MAARGVICGGATPHRTGAMPWPPFRRLLCLRTCAPASDAHRCAMTDGFPQTTATPFRRGAGPHPIDVQVGTRIRLKRKLLGWSQARLAEAVGLTFQQVQKYERGTNRVTVSKLWDLARAMETDVGYFFEGYEDLAEPAATEMVPTRLVQELLLTPEGVELAAAFPRAPAAVRKCILQLIATLAAAS